MNNDIQILKSKISMRELMRQLGFRNIQNNHAQCILHDDNKTLSFSFNNDVFYCFGCQAKGDKIELVKNALCVDFKSAVEFLTKETGFYPNIHLKRSKIDHRQDVAELILAQKESNRNFALQYIIDEMDNVTKLIAIWTDAAIKLRKKNDFKNFEMVINHLDYLDTWYGFLKYQRREFWTKMQRTR